VLDNVKNEFSINIFNILIVGCKEGCEEGEERVRRKELVTTAWKRKNG
jgi:hypothetical protein|tara:strand:- start:516 stop:659 length:144 start_codon:yes stop_codon:yes gene_type:complete